MRAAGRADAMLAAGLESEWGAAVGAGRSVGPVETEPALTAAETAGPAAAACSAETALVTSVSAAAADGLCAGAAGTWAGAWRERAPRRPLAASVGAGRRAGPGE